MINHPEISWKHFPAGPLACNCTLIADQKSRSGIVIDPGGDVDVIMDFITEHQLTKISVVHTHAHFDHILAAGELKERTGASLGLHADDRPLWDHLEDQCRLFGVPFKPLPPPDLALEHGQEIILPSMRGKSLHTPGHTPGSMCFLFESIGLLVAGDTLFRGGIGRTDLWGGDYQKISHSIGRILYTLDETLTVITGHGPSTTLGHEMRSNPFIRA